MSGSGSCGRRVAGPGFGYPTLRCRLLLLSLSVVLMGWCTALHCRPTVPQPDALPCAPLCRWCVQHGLLPREEAEAWVLQQAQVRRGGGGLSGTTAWAMCLLVEAPVFPACIWIQSILPHASLLLSTVPPATSSMLSVPQKKGGKSPAKAAAKRPVKAAEPKRKRAAAADDRCGAGQTAYCGWPMRFYLQPWLLWLQCMTLADE